MPFSKKYGQVVHHLLSRTTSVLWCTPRPIVVSHLYRLGALCSIRIGTVISTNCLCGYKRHFVFSHRPPMSSSSFPCSCVGMHTPTTMLCKPPSNLQSPNSSLHSNIANAPPIHIPANNRIVMNVFDLLPHHFRILNILWMHTFLPETLTLIATEPPLAENMDALNIRANPASGFVRYVGVTKYGDNHRDPLRRRTGT
jgi:hypothetical protein